MLLGGRCCVCVCFVFVSIACRYVSALICMYACMYACELGGSFAGGSPCLAIYIGDYRGYISYQ